METKSLYNSQFPPLNAGRMERSFADRIKGNKSNSGNLSNHEHQIYERNAQKNKIFKDASTQTETIAGVTKEKLPSTGRPTEQFDCNKLYQCLSELFCGNILQESRAVRKCLVLAAMRHSFGAKIHYLNEQDETSNAGNDETLDEEIDQDVISDNATMDEDSVIPETLQSTGIIPDTFHMQTRTSKKNDNVILTEGERKKLTGKVNNGGSNNEGNKSGIMGNNSGRVKKKKPNE